MDSRSTFAGVPSAERDFDRDYFFIYFCAAKGTGGRGRAGPNPPAYCRVRCAKEKNTMRTPKAIHELSNLVKKLTGQKTTHRRREKGERKKSKAKHPFSYYQRKRKE